MKRHDSLGREKKRGRLTKVMMVHGYEPTSHRRQQRACSGRSQCGNLIPFQGKDTNSSAVLVPERDELVLAVGAVLEGKVHHIKAADVLPSRVSAQGWHVHSRHHHHHTGDTPPWRRQAQRRYIKFVFSLLGGLPPSQSQMLASARMPVWGAFTTPAPHAKVYFLEGNSSV